MKREKIGILGLVINALGVLISAVSFTEYTGQSVTSTQSGIQYHPAFISSWGFKIGLYLLILGFIFQILEKVNHDKDVVPVKYINMTWGLTAIIYIILIEISKLLLFI